MGKYHMFSSCFYKSDAFMKYDKTGQTGVFQSTPPEQTSPTTPLASCLHSTNNQLADCSRMKKSENSRHYLAVLFISFEPIRKMNKQNHATINNCLNPTNTGRILRSHTTHRSCDGDLSLRKARVFYVTNSCLCFVWHSLPCGRTRLKFKFSTGKYRWTACRKWNNLKR